MLSNSAEEGKRLGINYLLNYLRFSLSSDIQRVIILFN